MFIPRGMCQVISFKVEDDKRVGNEAEFLQHEALYLCFGEAFKNYAYFFGSEFLEVFDDYFIYEVIWGVYNVLFVFLQLFAFFGFFVYLFYQ